MKDGFKFGFAVPSPSWILILRTGALTDGEG